MKSLKKEIEEEDDDFLEDLVVDTNPEEPRKLTTYSNLEPGGFVMKGADRKSRLDQRHARIVAATGEQDDDNDDKDETARKVGA